MNHTQEEKIMSSTRINFFGKGLLYSALFITSTSLQASGFQTSYHSVSSFSRGLGGAGVSGDDLADFYYNPAALSMYSRGNWQASFGVGNFENDYKDKGSTRSPLGPSDGPEEGIDEDLLNISGQYIPKTFLQGDNIQFGLFLGNAFGNQTEYSDDWIGRYHATESSLRAYDLSPTISFAVGKKTNLGLALSIQHSTAEISQALIIPTMADGDAKVEGDDTAFGWAIGIVHELENATLGFSYRSNVKHTLDGDLTIKDTPTLDGKYSAKAELDLPETVYLSARFGFDNYKKWGLYWTSRWTRWSRNEELKIEVSDPNIGDSVTPQNWNDTWLHGLGLSYRYNEKTLLRFGLTVDETPIPDDENRTPRQPEGDRQWISFGLSRTLDKGGVIDIGINHQIIDDGDIDNTATILSNPIVVDDNLYGTYEDGSFTLLGIQYRKMIK
jgi:long-chain fatty acid transport protein